MNFSALQLRKVIQSLIWPALVLLILADLAPPSARAADEVIIRSGPETTHTVALTFDDGPTPAYTTKILQLLRRYQARATFFVIGRHVEANPELVRAQLSGGHEVGNHSYTHPRFPKTPQLTREQELEHTALDLDLMGCPRAPRLFRPPYSAFDNRLTSYLAHTHRYLVLWGIDSGDWRGLAAPAIVANVLGRVKDGAIIIFHDGDEKDQADRSPTVEALKIILPALKNAGYRMVTVSELMGLKGGGS